MNISPFPHSHCISASFPHSLSIFSHPGRKDAASCATLRLSCRCVDIGLYCKGIPHKMYCYCNYIKLFCSLSYFITNLNVFNYIVLHVRQSGSFTKGIKANFPVHVSSEIASEIKRASAIFRPIFFALIAISGT